MNHYKITGEANTHISYKSWVGNWMNTWYGWDENKDQINDGVEGYGGSNAWDERGLISSMCVTGSHEHDGGCWLSLSCINYVSCIILTFVLFSSPTASLTSIVILLLSFEYKLMRSLSSLLLSDHFLYTIPRESTRCPSLVSLIR